MTRKRGRMPQILAALAFAGVVTLGGAQAASALGGALS